MNNVRVFYTIGKVNLIRNGKRKTIEAIPFKESVELKDGDRIVTGAASYVVDLSDRPGPSQTGTLITVLPNSEIVLGIKGNLITRIEVINGLFKIATDKEVITPAAELRFIQGVNVFWVDVSKDGAVVVASEVIPMEVAHKKTKRGTVVNFKQQVTVNREDISEPCAVDGRFKEAYKLVEKLEQSKAKFLYGDMLERNVPQELEKFAGVIEENTEKKENHDLNKYENWLKEQKEFGEWKYEEAVESELPEFKPVKAEAEIVPAVASKIVEFNKTVNYQGVVFKMVSAEKTSQYKGRNAPENKNFLVLNIEAKNNSTKQTFVFYDEEIRLITVVGEIIPLENYKLETSFDPSFETKGFLLFIIAGEDKAFRLQFGKKNLSKTEMEFEFPEDYI